MPLPSDFRMAKHDVDLPSCDREYEDGTSSLVDDGRSSPSQKSDAGYHSSGAMDDNARDRDYSALYSCMRSSGSVGSQESERGDRSSFKGFPGHAAHMVNGETRFPTAMSYTSDAQRSDVATVCSGSVVEDIEVESVLSQEDNPNSRQSPPLEKRRIASSSRFVEFAGVPPVPCCNNVNVLPGQQPDPSPQIAVHAMGPPLNRALLLKAEGGTSSSQAGSIKSSAGSVGSDDGRRAHSDDGTGSLLDVEVPPDSNDAKGGASSVRSLEGSDGAQEADDVGSLDVETHSLGTRSIHSQDDAAPLPEDDVVVRPAGISSSTTSNECDATTMLQDVEETCNGGRQSPGGTIYKGRGTRRYQGRYMHLPLKRFHHNGVHLDVVDELHSTNGGHPLPQHQRQHNDIAPPWNDQSNGRKRDSYERNGYKRSRSRSRSRSPEEDRKPRAPSDSFSSFRNNFSINNINK